MAALLPLIHELLPMILPSSVHVARGSEIVPQPPAPAPPHADEGIGAADNAGKHPGAARRAEVPGRVVTRDAIVGKTDKMCASVLIAPPQASSAVHHHGEQDAIIFAASGTGILLTGPPDDEPEAEPVRHALAPGDFAFVPAWTEHQAVNESADEELRWVVIRSGSHPTEVGLTDWGGAQA